MSTRFYVPNTIRASTVSLDDDQAHHLIHVMRAKIDTRVILFDGSGTEYSARVRQISRREVQLEVLSRREIDRELPFSLVVGVALPKGDRQKWLVEKAVELGADRLVPLITSRGVVQPTKNLVNKLRRTVIESSKQCGRNRLMVVDAAQRMMDYLRAAPNDATRWMAHPDADNSPAVAPQRLSPSADRHVYLAVGPEGGFTAEEVKAASDTGWDAVSLGPRILRVETAAIALIARVALP